MACRALCALGRGMGDFAALAAERFVSNVEVSILDNVVFFDAPEVVALRPSRLKRNLGSRGNIRLEQNCRGVLDAICVVGLNLRLSLDLRLPRACGHVGNFGHRWDRNPGIVMIHWHVARKGE